MIYEVSNLNNNKIIETIDVENLTESETKLLNIKKKYKKFSYIEKCIFKISKKLCSICNLDFDEKNIEFWFKKNNNQGFHVDCDEENKKNDLINYKYPLITSILYLVDHEDPTVITDISMDCYKYKKFDMNNTIDIIYPKKSTLLIFNGKNFHSALNLNNIIKNNRYLIAINIWGKTYPKIPIYKSIYKTYSKTKIKFSYKKSKLNDINNHYITNNILNRENFDDLLYKNNATFLKEYIKHKNIYTNTKLLTKIPNVDEDILTFLEHSKNKLLDEQINELKYNDKIELNRFYIKCYSKSFISRDMCEYIINESEKYACESNNGWTTARHTKYPTTDIPITNINSIASIASWLFKDLSLFIHRTYNITDKYNLNFNDVFIVKYEYIENKQKSLEFHTDGSLLSFQILLNDKFSGGGTIFSDGTYLTPEIGDLHIHPGKMKHAGVPITSGKRYLIVGFIQII